MLMHFKFVQGSELRLYVQIVARFGLITRRRLYSVNIHSALLQEIIQVLRALEAIRIGKSENEMT